MKREGECCHWFLRKHLPPVCSLLPLAVKSLLFNQTLTGPFIRTHRPHIVRSGCPLLHLVPVHQAAPGLDRLGPSRSVQTDLDVSSDLPRQWTEQKIPLLITAYRVPGGAERRHIALCRAGRCGERGAQVSDRIVPTAVPRGAISFDSSDCLNCNENGCN